MKKLLIFLILAILAAACGLYFYSNRLSLNLTDENGAVSDKNEVNLKENLQILGNKIKKEAKNKLDKAEQTIKDERAYHEQLKNEANREVKIFEPIYKSDKDDKKSQKDKTEPSLQNEQNEPKKPSKNSKKIEIDIN